MKNSPEKFDRISARFINERSLYNTEALQALPEEYGISMQGERLLDLGCGNGDPVCRYYHSRGAVITGVDFSEAILRIARANFPDAEFITADVEDLELPENCFGLVTCFYMLFCLSTEAQFRLIRKVQDCLKEGGGFLFCTLGPFSKDQPDFAGTLPFLGEEFYLSYASTQTYRDKLNAEGFRILYCKEQKINNETMTWWLAQKL